MTSSVVIGRCPEAEVPRLFGLAKSAFAGAPGWSDARVLQALARDLLFLAKEGGQPAGYVALRHEPNGTYVFRYTIHGTQNGAPVELTATTPPIEMID